MKPTLSFPDALKLAFSRIMVTDGRSRRSEFWWTMLVCSIVFGIVFNINRGIATTGGSILVGLLSCAIWCATVPLQIRRLHDTGRGGTLALIGACLYILEVLCSILFVATIGWLWGTLMVVALIAWLVITIILVVFWTQDSQPGTNQYGPNPKE